MSGPNSSFKKRVKKRVEVRTLEREEGRGGVDLMRENSLLGKAFPDAGLHGGMRAAVLVRGVLPFPLW